MLAEAITSLIKKKPVVAKYNSVKLEDNCKKTLVLNIITNEALPIINFNKFL